MAAAFLLLAFWLPVAPAAASSAPAKPNSATLPPSAELRAPSASVLSKADTAAYRRIFALQEQGRWRAADQLIAELGDDVLMGHVLFQRYMHPTAYRSKFRELADWMARFADHPGAARVYRLAMKRRPAGADRPRPPVWSATPLGAVSPEPGAYRTTKRLNARERQRVHQIKRQIRRNVLRTRLSATEDLLATREAARLLDRVEIDQGHAEVARGWFHYGDDAKAFALAAPAAERSGAQAPMAHWIAGLAAWRLGRMQDAARHFGGVATAARVSGWMQAAGAYWAARAHLKLRRPEEMSRWLALAAGHRHTFYGVLAREALGLPLGPSADESPAGDPGPLLARPAGRRAVALVEAGQPERAEAELRGLPLSQDAALARAALIFAERGGMAPLAFRLANHLRGRADGLGLSPAELEAGLFPLPDWTPAGGYSVDRALIYALVRRESAFRTRAHSRDGARGLMQLMPATARFVAGGRLDLHRLYDPAINLDLGQRYIDHLLNHPYVRGDLFRLAAAYNGGPGNLGRWSRETAHHDDPLLFIESLPSRETRLFIERVLTNLWIYRARLGQPAPSLADVAAGDWPHYRALDSRVEEIARNAGSTNAQD